MARSVQKIDGDFGEIGVYRGAAFRVLAILAHGQGRTAHAFDSFRGMDEPGPEDGAQYPKGKFDIGGSGQFSRLMHEAGIPDSYYRLWPGYVPACFEAFPGELRFALLVIDVDHYGPTAKSLQWAARRINPGGILALDDYVPASEGLATKAINEFLVRDREFERIAEFNQQLILRRR